MRQPRARAGEDEHPEPLEIVRVRLSRSDLPLHLERTKRRVTSVDEQLGGVPIPGAECPLSALATR